MRGPFGASVEQRRSRFGRGDETEKRSRDRRTEACKLLGESITRSGDCSFRPFTLVRLHSAGQILGGAQIRKDRTGSRGFCGLKRRNSDRTMKKILIIEGQPEMRRNLMTILRLEKFHPLPAENGRVGIELAKREQPDLIVSDIVLPELDGFGVIAAVRASAETISIPFIFLTANGEKRDVAMNLGADEYLTKPVAKTDLLEVIRSRLALN